MTDNEIIQALTCCSFGCDHCPYESLKDEDKLDCIGAMTANTLDLIDRQQAEIEKLNSEVKEKTKTIDFLKDQVVSWNNNYCELKTKLKTAKADKVIAERHEKDARDLFKGVVGQLAVAKSEAIKEFSERLKEEIICDTAYGCDCNQHSGYYDYKIKIGDIPEYIDNLVKEMTEEK